MIGSRRRIGKFWGGGDGADDALAEMCRILPRFIGPWRRESTQPELGVVLISLILLHAGRWDPVFLSEKWQDGRRAA